MEWDKHSDKRQAHEKGGNDDSLGWGGRGPTAHVCKNSKHGSLKCFTGSFLGGLIGLVVGVLVNAVLYGLLLLLFMYRLALLGSDFGFSASMYHGIPVELDLKSD
jgi:hypothetical protein